MWKMQKGGLLSLRWALQGLPKMEEKICGKKQKTEGLQVTYHALDELKTYEGNAKRHPAVQVRQIMESIQDYGFNDPIAVDENMMIIEGHGRYEACRQLGMDKVPVIQLIGLTDEQKKEYILVHNKITMNSGFDMQKLQEELKKLPKFKTKLYKLNNKFMKDHDYKKKTQESVSNILNLKYAQFPGVGKYDIPEIMPVYELPEGIEEWIGFNYVLSDDHPGNKAVHFFVDDYQFERVWNQPDKYLEKLSKYKCVLSPDFSPYGDMPLAAQLFNHYRKHWVAAYWQQKGLTVIPTIRSSTDRRSLEFFLDGEPQGGVVAYSSMWCDNGYNKASAAEWYRMISILNPSAIVVYGDIFEFMKTDANIIQIPKFSQKRWNR